MCWAFYIFMLLTSKSSPTRENDVGLKNIPKVLGCGVLHSIHRLPDFLSVIYLLTLLLGGGGG